MRSGERVGDVVLRVRRGLARRAWGAAAMAAAAALGLVLLVAWALAGDAGWRQGTAWPLTLDLALLLGLAAGGWWIHRRLRSWLGEASLASSMEHAAGLPSGAVLGSLELARELPAGVSSSLASRGETNVMSRLAAAEERLEGRLGGEIGQWARRARNGMVILAPLVVMVAILWPDRTATAWRGLGQPVQLLAGPVLPSLEVRPGDVEVERGADVDVTVRAPFRDSVTLHWQASGDVPRSTAAPVAADSGAAFQVRDVRTPVLYHVTSQDGARSPSYRIVPMDPLMVTDVTLRLDYPVHTGRPADEYRGDVPPLTVPAGTRVEVEGSASHVLEEAVLTEATGDAMALDVEGAEFRGSWVPRGDEELVWSFRDERNRLAGTVPPPLRFTVVPDSAPEVVFTFPARDTLVPLNLRQPLILQVRDDYGIQAVELVAYRVGASGQREDPVVQVLDLGGPRGAVARPVLDLSDWGLVPGDTVRYHARAVDNAPSPGTGVSREWVLRMPGSAEMRRDAGARLDDTAEELSRLAEDVGRAEEQTRSMERRARSGDRATDERGDARPETRNGEAAEFQEREDVRQALEEQDELQERVDSLRGEMEAMARALEEAGESDPGLREDLDRLRELMDEIVPPEARERLREMLEDVESMEAGERQEALGELQEQQTSFREQLESSLERFRRAAVDQDFRATTAEAQELARREEALSEELRSGDDPELRADQQEALRDEAEATEEQMERLQERLQELGETDAAREVQEARDRSAQAEGSMEQAGREAREGRPEQAGDQAASASEAMDQAAEQLREAQSQMSTERARAFQQALEGTADDALALAREQSRIREEMTGAAGQEMERLRGDVAAVEQGMRSLADQMAQTASESGAPDRQLAGEMGRAMEALERTREAMEGGTGPRPSPRGSAEQAVEALNQVARTAMEQALAMEQGEGSQGMSAGGLQQRLQDLAQQQGSLNNQAGQMMPMQLGPNATESQARQMAEGQQSVADELGEMAAEPGGEEQALGSLEAMAQEAEALARELAGGRLDTETRRRQEELFRRLLDAGRTLEKDEYSDEREASRPGTFERAEVEALDPADMNVLMYRLPSADVLQRLSPGARRLVIEYFERLNRGGPEGAAEVPPEGGGGG